jgi:hypothetical protein
MSTAQGLTKRELSGIREFYLTPEAEYDAKTVARLLAVRVDAIAEQLDVPPETPRITRDQAEDLFRITYAPFQIESALGPDAMRAMPAALRSVTLEVKVPTFLLSQLRADAADGKWCGENDAISLFLWDMASEQFGDDSGRDASRE